MRPSPGRHRRSYRRTRILPALLGASASSRPCLSRAAAAAAAAAASRFGTGVFRSRWRWSSSPSPTRPRRPTVRREKAGPPPGGRGRRRCPGLATVLAVGAGDGAGVPRAPRPTRGHSGPARQRVTQGALRRPVPAPVQRLRRDQPIRPAPPGQRPAERDAGLATAANSAGFWLKKLPISAMCTASRTTRG